MPSRSAASAHWVRRWSVGHDDDDPVDRAALRAAARPASARTWSCRRPGVAVTRKSRRGLCGLVGAPAPRAASARSAGCGRSPGCCHDLSSSPGCVVVSSDARRARRGAAVAHPNRAVITAPDTTRRRARRHTRAAGAARHGTRAVGTLVSRGPGSARRGTGSAARRALAAAAAACCCAAPSPRRGRTACSACPPRRRSGSCCRLPSLFLALVATLGYVSRWFGAATVEPHRGAHRERR